MTTPPYHEVVSLSAELLSRGDQLAKALEALMDPKDHVITCPKRNAEAQGYNAELTGDECSGECKAAFTALYRWKNGI